MINIIKLLEEHGDKGVIVQGITGKFGSRHTKLMQEYGTKIVAGVTPGKGGQHFDGIPIYNSVKEAKEHTDAIVSIVFVPAANFLTAAEDALMNGIKLMVAIPEHVPIKDSLKVLRLAKQKEAIVIGPNTPGVIIPEKIKIGIMPAMPFKKGKTAVFSRSGTLMYEISYRLSLAGYGQRIALGIGGDPINCTNLIECFEFIRDDDSVDSVVVVGEIGGDAEEQLANYIIETNFSKPVVAYIAGRSAPREKRMGHAGAIIYGSFGSAESKLEMFRKAGVEVAMKPAEVPSLLSKLI